MPLVHVSVHNDFAYVYLIYEEHTDVNHPLLHSWLTCMPVIPKAELHFWGLVILKHSHYYCLKWRKMTEK